MSSHARMLRGLCVLIAAWLGAGVLALSLPAGADGPRLHRRVDPDVVQCSHCHSTETWSFDWQHAAEGPFDHGWTGFPLLGSHARAACLDCHERELQPSRACNGCHEDRHRGRLGQDCDRCHNAQAFSDVTPRVAHRNARLPLTGMHALIECSACHVRTLAAPEDAPPSDCFACHQEDYERHTNHPRHFRDPSDPSREAFPTDCRQCHVTLAWSPARLPRELASPSSLRAALSADPAAAALSRREHERHFPILLGSHAQAECNDCHTAGRAAALSCAGCHAHAEPALRKQHASVALPASRAGALCVSCHARGARR